MKSIICSALMALLASADVLFGQSVIHPWRAMAPAGGTSSSAGRILLFSAGQPIIGITDSGAVNLESGSLPGVRLLNGTTAFSSSLTEQGWNMASVPLVVSDYRKTSLYPTAISVAFAFSSNAYVVRDTLQNGIGYWVKFGAPDTISSSGTALIQDTIDVQQGWNMIGSIHYPFLVSDVVPIPPVTIHGDFYRFSFATGYSPVDTLNPAHAYWVKVSSPGKLILNSGSLLESPATHVLSEGKSAKRLKHKLNMTDDGEICVITVGDTRGAKRDLLFGTQRAEMETDAIELPPIPPAGVFDIRFASQRACEFVTQANEAKEFPILVNSAAYPITITWEGILPQQDAILIFTYPNKPATQQPITGTGTLVVTDNSFTEMKLVLKAQKSAELPKFIALQQNHPNPFNPLTIINYQLPVNNYVTLKVYDLLGKEVTTLVDGTQQAGFKSVEFDASGLASGVYIYRMQVGDYSSAKKLVVLK